MKRAIGFFDSGVGGIKRGKSSPERKLHIPWRYKKRPLRSKERRGYKGSYGKLRK